MATKAKVVATVTFRRPTGLYWGVKFGGLWPASRHHLNLKATPPGDVVFELSNGAIKSGFHFDTKDPIWVGIDDGNCPPRGSSHPDIVDIRSTRDRVTVTNRKATGPVRLRYQLNVLNRSGGREPIDPIIEN